MTSDEGSL